eukprot:scaffold243473_cov26-Tisochrysis_lutea.AAC.8
MECVVRTVQQSRVRRFMTAHKKRLDAASIPEDGSSSSTREGRPTRAMPTQSLRLLPPEYVPAGLSAKERRSRSRSSSSTSASIRRAVRRAAGNSRQGAVCGAGRAVMTSHGAGHRPC